MDIVETIIDAGFDPSIQDLMDHEEYESLIERAMDGNPAARTTYIERLFDVVRGIDEILYLALIHKVILHGPDKGVEEFLTDVEDRVILFEEEVRDKLRQHIRQGLPTMKEPLEIELEEETNTDELVFRFWAGDGATPVAEFTCKDPEARPNFRRDGIHDVIAASWIPEMRKVVEDTLHDLRENMKRGEDA